MKNFFLNISSLLITILIIFLLTEVAVRIVVDNGFNYELEMMKYAQKVKKLETVNEQEIFLHKPNIDTTIMRTNVKTDINGFRYNKKQKDNTKKIMLLGDSMTFGFGSNYTFADFLQEKLYNEYKILNTGVGNTNTTMQEKGFFEFHKKHNPNILVINFVINDDEHSVSYRYEKNKGFIFDSDKIGIIHAEDDFGIDVEFNAKRHYSRITLKNENILVHMPFGDVMLKIKPRFVLPGIEIQAGSLTAPMPGKVIALNVKKGSKVKIGDVLVILEAMKMEHSIKASHNGIVSKVLISKDDQVENGAPLMIVDSK